MDSLPFCPIVLPAKRTPHPFPNGLNAIAQSPLRPNVAVPDCFVHWLTPFGINSMNRAAENFPPETIARERFVLTQCVKPETLSNYSAGLLRFMRFCDDFEYPKQPRYLLKNLSFASSLLLMVPATLASSLPGSLVSNYGTQLTTLRGWEECALPTPSKA